MPVIMRYVTALALMILYVTAPHEGGATQSSAMHVSLREADLPSLIHAREFYPGRYKSWGHQLSPDGKRLAWMETAKGKAKLRVRMLKNGHTVTMSHPVPVIRFYWALDSRHLLFIASVDNDGNTRLFLADTDSPRGQPRHLSPPEWTNVRSIITPLAEPNSVLVQASLRTNRIHHLYEINLETGFHELRATNHGDTWRWIISDKGDVLGQLQHDADGGWSVQSSVGSVGSATVLTGEFTDTINIVQNVPDRSSKVYTVTSGEQDKVVLLTLDLNTGEQQVILERPGRDISHVFMELIAYRPLMVEHHDGFPRYHYFDRDLQEDVERLLGPGPVLFRITSGSLDLMRLIIHAETDQSESSVYLVDRRSETKKALVRAPLKRYEEFLSPTHPIHFEARDGLSISGYLTIPKGTEGKHLPMVLKVHGGPWLRDYWGFDSDTQFLANRGYAVLEVNYRGSGGFTKSFMENGYRELGGKMQDDLIDAVDWAIAEGYADPEKVAIYGHSYGGYAALVGLTKTPGKFAAGVNAMGFSDLASLVSTFSRRGTSARAWWSHFAGDPAERGIRQELLERSPITYAHRVKRPLLIVHGAKDKQVSKEQSDRFVEKLRENDIPVEYLVFPDEGHVIRKRENRLEFARRLESFLAIHLGGRAGSEK